MHSHPITPSRAQGEQSIPWPADIAGEPETCCVALRIEVTQDRVDGDVEILDDRPRVGVGEPEKTLRDLINLINYRLEGVDRDVLLAELDAVGWIDPRCPLVLERLHVSGARAVHVEALILPVACEQVSELDELLRDESDPDTRHGLGWLYAEDLAELWRGAAAPDGRLPVRFLEDAIDQERPAQQPVPVAQAPALAGV